MAKLILDDSYPSQVSPIYSWWRIVLVGAGMGSFYYLLTNLIGSWVVDPVFCGSALNVDICNNSVEVSGNIAVVLITVTGMAVLVRLGVLRPLIITLATAISLWGLAGWTNGLGWAEVAMWDALLFALGYLLFSWISRYTRSVAVLVTVFIIVVVLRIMLAL